ncbi:hypothetical protein Ahy_B07g086946 [Arachis hypogaea]|uniref:Uncharacterized protein n=1 Tax=Arachis hypogaea TaxID=3818 RepID=A0A444YB06_ARAHY|nr:hypothetical protein Ahy_B07g086946 [Arachis hypogaea]
MKHEERNQTRSDELQSHGDYFVNSVIHLLRESDNFYEEQQRFVKMPRRPQYNIIWEPPKDVRTNTETEDTMKSSNMTVPPVFSPANSDPASRINEPFHAPRNDKCLAPSSISDGPQTPTEHTETQYRDEVADKPSEDEDYNPKADEVESFDDHIEDLFAMQEAEVRNNDKKHKDTDYWKVTVIEDDMTKGSELSVKESITLPPNTKIILLFNKELQPIGQPAGLLSGFLESLDADYSQFPICEESWKNMNKANKEHAYNMVKNWKDTRHNLYHKFYNETKTLEKNIKHRPLEIEENNWKWFLEYRLKEETKKKCKQNALNRSKQIYTHTGSSKILARQKDEEEAIANIESQDKSSKLLSQNDSLAQLFGKEHAG